MSSRVVIISREDRRQFIKSMLGDMLRHSFEWTPIVDKQFVRIDNKYDVSEQNKECIDLTKSMYEVAILFENVKDVDLFDLLDGNDVTVFSVIHKILNECFEDFYSIWVLGMYVIVSLIDDEDTSVFVNDYMYAIVVYMILRKFKLKSFGKFDKKIEVKYKSSKINNYSYIYVEKKVKMTEYPPYGLLFALENDLLPGYDSARKLLKKYEGHKSESKSLMQTFFLCISGDVEVHNKDKIKELSESLAKSVKQVEKYKSINVELKKDVRELKNNQVNYNKDDNIEYKRLKLNNARLLEENDMLYYRVEERDDEIERLQRRLERTSILLDTYKQYLSDEDVSVCEELADGMVDEVDISSINILIITNESNQKRYKYTIYDYYSAPQRIDILNNYDIVVLLLPGLKHKMSVPIVDYCKQHNIEYMMLRNTNSEVIDREIKNYVKFKRFI